MKVQGEVNPGTYSIEPMPKKPGWVLCRFYENAKQSSAAREDGSVVTGWEYDEYHLEQPDNEWLERDIQNNYAVFMQAAKDTEAPTEVERLRADVDFMMALEGLL